MSTLAYSHFRYIVPGPNRSTLLIKHMFLNISNLAASLLISLCIVSRVGASDVKIGGMLEGEARAWWAFQPLPAAEANPSSARVDGFIDEALAACGLEANPSADARTLRRRLSYGLTGLPPDHLEAKPFAEQVEELLGSAQYGVHWGRRWLDVVRYADTAGENTDRPLPHAWRYRNWVIDAFNRDMAYDQFVQLQLAGDLLNADAVDAEFREGIIATGYLAIARRFGHDTDDDIHLMYEDVINNLGETFMGLTLGCARCHDHKYDPVTAEDYYALYGIFDSSRFSYSGSEKESAPRDLVPLLHPREMEELNATWQARLKFKETQKVELHARVTAGRARINEWSVGNTHLLLESVVDEGQEVLIEGPSVENVVLRKGEVLQLIVDANGTVRDDTTLVEWTIEQGDEVWDLADLIPHLTLDNPQPDGGSPCWYFIAHNGPTMLDHSEEEIDGHSELKIWSLNGQESVFANQSDAPMQVWTTLPPKSLFLLPGRHGAVAVAWVSPVDGPVRITGRVKDVHPHTHEGVRFKVEHLAHPGLGEAFADLGVANHRSPEKPEVPTAYAVVDDEVKNTRVHLRGEPETLGDEVPRRWLSVFGGQVLPPEAGSGRRELGEWITRHPLFARVMVNRIWQGHFGEGLVRSPNDFGARGEAPTHPELLDWLAAQFVASGYSVKAMHRLILGTEAYQRSSASSPVLAEVDAKNHWLARFSRRRLSAEELRDSLLELAGTLNLEPGGAHPFPPVDAWEFTQHKPFHAVFESDHRSAFLMVQRQRAHPFLSLFDGADPNTSTAERENTTVPTQALYFLNDPFFHEQALQVSKSFLGSARERIAMAYQTVFDRAHAPAEQLDAARFLSAYPGTPEERWAAFARILLASNEFLHLD